MSLIKSINENILLYPEKKNILTDIRDELIKLEKQSKEEVNLIFIAEKGAGKTTIISQLLGLTLEVEKTNEDNNRKYTVEQDVLETGSGATTLSEVALVQSLDKKTKVRIIPYTKEECIDLLKSFSVMIFNKAHNLPNSETLDTEIIRACRNMTGLLDKRQEKKDLALELALQYNVNEIEVYCNEVIKMANIESRIRTEFIYDFSKDDEKVWLKKKFRQINLIHISDAPLPKKIIIEINEDIFSFNNLGKINKIIDTRGLDAGSVTDRSDIKDYFKEDKNNILIFVDKFNSPSKVLIDLLTHYAYDKDLDIINRLGYLVNFKDGEPSKVLSNDGRVKDEVEGIEVKKGQVAQIFSNEQIYITCSNMIYYNPKRFIAEDGQIIVTVDEMEDFGSKIGVINHKKDIKKIENKEFIDNILTLENRYRIDVERKIVKLKQQYYDLISSLDQNPCLDVAHICEYLEEEYLKINAVKYVPQMYDKYIAGKYASTLMAVHNRYGIYYDTDIFCEGANYLVSSIRNDLQYLKDAIIDKLDMLQTDVYLNKVQKSNLESVRRKINQLFFNLNDTVYKVFYEELRDNTFSRENDDFWCMVKSRWGEGAGYKKDILDLYKINLKENNFASNAQHIAEVFVIDFKKSCIDILNEYSK